MGGKLKEFWLALQGQFPLLRKGWSVVVVIGAVGVVGLFAKDFFGGLGKNAADRLLPAEHSKPPADAGPPTQVADGAPSLSIVNVDLLDPQGYFRWSGTTFSPKQIGSLKAYYDDETWSDSVVPGGAGPPSLYQSDDNCVRPSLKYFGSVTLGLANQAQKLHLRHGKVPDVGPDGEPAGQDRAFWEPLLTEVRVSLIGATYSPLVMLKEASRLAQSGAAGLKLSEKGGGASPTVQVIVDNKGAVPDIITGISSYVVSASGHATVGGSEEYEAGPLKVAAAASVKFDSHTDQSTARLDSPVIIPPHGFARLAVRLDPGSLFSAALGQDSQRKRKLPVEYGEDVTSMVFGGVQLKHGEGSWLRTPTFCVSYIITS